MKSFLNNDERAILKLIAVIILTVLIIFGLGLLLYNLSGFFAKLWKLFTAVLQPITIGAILCYLLLPVVHFVEKKLPQKYSLPIRRKISTAVTVGSILLAVFVLMFILISAIARKIEAIDINDIENLYTLLIGQYQEFVTLVIEQLSKIGISAESVLSKVGAILSDIPKILSTTLFSLVFAIYFLLDGTRIASYWRKVLTALAGEKAKKRLELLLQDSDKVFSGYIRGQFVDAFIVGMMVGAALLIAGIPYAILIGILTGVANLIPYMGGFVGYGSLIVACISTGDLKKLVIGIILITVVMVVDANIINPRLLSQNIHIHPLLVVASLIAGGSLGGFLGMLVAVPVGALLKIQLDRYVEKTERIAGE